MTKLLKILRKLHLLIYRETIKSKIKKIRKKEIISVLFILTDISKWKSEELYLEMLSNPRFNPVLGISMRIGETPSAIARKTFGIIEYLKSKRYDYIELINTVKPDPDIIIYTEPYGASVPFSQRVFQYFNSLFINIPYTCHTGHLNIDYFMTMHKYAWIDCYENQEAIEEAYQYIGKKRKNITHTGLPMFDVLLKNALSDPWKKQQKRKKRIIWAPHHSLGGFENETIVYSNFLEISQFMFEIAQEYEEEIQIAFKPHPLLRAKLENVWGYDETKEYYSNWKNLPNGQLEEGEYTDLFKTSDAMIHDSASFIIEYQVLEKPILFIVRDEKSIIEDMTVFGKTMFYKQTLAYNKQDIKSFIKSLTTDASSITPKENSNKKLVMPLNQRTASENIIDIILCGCMKNNDQL